MTAQTLTVPGARLHYAVTGSGPALLLIPGGPADSGAFDGLRGPLSEHYTVVTYDPRGISRSPLDGQPIDDDRELLRQHADDIHHLLTAVTSEPAFVFASSGGAVSALDHLTRYPGKVATLIAHEPPITRYLGAPAPGAPDLKKVYREQGVGPAMAMFMASAGLDGGDAPQPPADPTPEQREQTALMQANFGFFLGHLMHAVGSYEPDLAALKATPARIVVAVGAESGGQPAHESARAFAADLGQEPAVFPGDHGFGDPGKFAARLHEVLGQH
ncbi:alpha/beta fold hydrolase [Amycolatopsis sp. NPDC059021]|uniref:alpha/beta fold hydrolase n=1 Tax=Amycolatopsis sp. NPDC059021 TaxID=3346704 RepID=UPI00366B7062